MINHQRSDAPGPHALIAQLDDPSAPLRRQAAIALGKTRGRAVTTALAAALDRDQDAGVRASLILALGAHGGPAAESALRGHRAEPGPEAEALAKALDRLAPARPETVRWRPGVKLAAPLLEVVDGLEHPASRMAVRDGLGQAQVEGPGLLRLPAPTAVETLWPPPRWAYGVRLLVATGATAEDVLDQAASPVWRDLIEADGDAPLRFRLGVEGRKKVGRDLHQDWLRRVRAALAPVGAVDSPSRYGFELILSFATDSVRLYFRPAMAGDPRFAYRLGDVGASINPVVAATLARLVPGPAGGTILDPTCGSGTLLFERALLAPDAPLLGIDISREANKVAAGNAAAGGFAPRLDLRQADCRDPALWSACGVVLANLPFGIRVGRDDADLDGLYQAVLANASRVLAADGRVLLATANRGGLERAIAATPTLRVLARHRFQSGGLFVQVAVLGHANSRPSPGGPGPGKHRPGSTRSANRR